MEPALYAIIAAVVTIGAFLALATVIKLGALERGNERGLTP